MTLFIAVYRRVLRLAPRAFVSQYEAEMVQVAGARVEERTGAARARHALVELVDLLGTVMRERRLARRPRAVSAGRWTTDARLAWINLRRRPVTPLAAAVLLGLGLGAATLGFAVMSSVLLRPLPYGDPDGLVLVWGVVPQIQVGLPEVPIHGTRLLSYQQTVKGASSLEGFKAEVFNLESPGASAERVDGLLTTAGLFDTMGVRPAAGRFFAAGEDVQGAPCVTVLGYRLWQRRFGGDPGVLQRTLRLSDRACTVVGIAPPGFEFPRGGEMPAAFQFPSRTEIWVASPPPVTGPSDLTVLGRLAPGTDAPALQAEFDAISRQMDTKRPQSRGWNDVKVVPLRRQVVPSAIAATVASLFGAMAMLLAVAIGGSAQLFVVRSLARRTALAVSAALGADPRRLVRQVGFEVVVVAGAGVALAIAGASAGARLVRQFGPERFPRLTETSVDGRALAFLLLGAGVTIVLTGLGPTIVARRISADAGLLRGRPRGGIDSLRRARAGLVFVQVALAAVLIVGSGLLVRSLLARLGVDPGFRADHGLTFEITLPADRFPEVLRGPIPASRQPTIAAVDDILSRVRALPGVTAAAMGKPLPMSGASEASVFVAESLPPPTSAREVPVAEYIVVSDEFFRAMGTPILAGREFTAADREDSENTVVVNEALARQLEAAGPVLGQHIKLGGSKASPAPWLTVVGIAKDMKRYALDDTPGPTMFVSYTQGGYPSLATLPFVVRTSVDDPTTLVAPIRRVMADAGLRVPVANPRRLSEVVAAVSADARFATTLMLAFAVVALVLAVAGLYGMVALTVSQRTRELGVRAVLGASPRQLVRLVAFDGLRPALGGAVAGLACAMLAARFMRGLLFGIATIDPVTFAGVPLLLATVVLAACLVPARRAATIDPRATLRGS